MINKGILSVLIMICLAQINNIHAQVMVDKVAAQVGAEYILLSDVEKQLSFQSEKGAVEDEELARCQIVESLIAQKVMIHQAKLDSLVVSEDEVNQQLEYRLKGILAQMNGNEDLFEEYYGQTIDEVRVWMRPSIKDMILAERMQMSILESISITPSETKSFFNKIDKDSLPYFNAEVEVAELVKVAEVNDTELGKAYDQALLIYNELVENEGDFEDLAKKYSQDAGSKRLGGDLGWQTRGTFVPEFEAVVYSLKKDEISEPVETQFGYHIIQLIDRRGNTIHARHILIKPEITADDIELAKNKLSEIRAEVLADSITFEKAIKKYGNDAVQSFNNNGRLTNPKNGTTFYETGDLPPDIYFAIEGLNPGDLTEPLEYIDPYTNETQYRIIKLLSRTKPHKANLQDDYSKIQFFAKENKKSEYFAEWIQDRMANTYMKVDSDYSSCPNLANWLK